MMQQDISGQGKGWQTEVKAGGTAYVAETIIIHPPPPQRSPAGIPYNLPHSGVTKFVGRDDDLKQLHEQLQTGSAIAISAISGMGGIGKTELALQYAYKHLDLQTYPGGVCWLRARQEVGTQIVSFVQTQLEITPPDDLELLEKVAFCWRQWRDGDVLVVFDDVQSYADIKPFLPPSRSRFKVVLTTRLQPQPPIQKCEIKVLSEEKALELLRAIVPDGRIDQQLKSAKQLCQWLGYLPLGLELVGRYLALEVDLNLNEMLARLQQKSLQQEALVRDEHDPMWTSTAERGVAAAFELSWQTLEVAAQQLGGVLSLFALAPIPWALVEATLGEINAMQRHRKRGWRKWWEALWQWLRTFWRQHPSPQAKFALNSVEAVEKARHSLLGLHLLQRNSEQVYELHQLLREFFAAKREQMADKDVMKQTVCRVMVAVADKMPIEPTRFQIEQSTAFIPHLKEVTTTLQPWLTDIDLIMPSTRIAQFYVGQSDYCEAVLWYQHCQEAAVIRLGRDHLAVAASLNNLAELYKTQGRYAEAEPLRLRCQEIEKQTLGENHPEFAASLCNLAGLYYLQGRYTEAEPLYIRALDITKRHLGQDHPAVATSLNNLAEFYKAQGRYTEAESLCAQALDIWKRHLGADHPTVATSLNNLAALYKTQGRYTEVEPLYTSALAIQEHQLGKDHPAVATILNNLAALYEAQGSYEAAEPLYTRALDIHEHKLGVDHPHVATSLSNLAGLYKAQGSYEAAEPLYTRALDITERQLGTNHPVVATRLNNLAGLYCLQGRDTEAEPLYTRALGIDERHLGADHPDVATSLNNLAGLYHDQGRYEAAEPLYTRALDITERHLGQDHPAVATSLNNLAGLYCSQGRDTEAEPLYTRALVIRERQLGQDHPDVATSLNNLAELYKTQGRYTEAEPLYTHALIICKHQLGQNHPHVAFSLNNLAELYKAQGRYTEAEPLYIQAVSILVQGLGNDHPNTVTVQANFFNFLQAVVDAGKTEQLSDHAVTQAFCGR